MPGSEKKEAVDQSPNHQYVKREAKELCQPSFPKANNIMPQRNGTTL